MGKEGWNTWLKVVLIVFLLFIIFGVFTSIFWSGQMGSGMMGGMMGFGWIYMLLPFILIISIIYFILERFGHSYSQSPYHERENPIQILERRYAGGEISRDEYLKMKEDIQEKVRP